MKEMQPKLNHLLIINDRSETGLAIKSELDMVLPKVIGSLHVEYVDDLDMETLKGQVTKLGENSAILFLLLFKDSTGKYFTYKESLQEVYEVSNVPIFGVWDFYLGLGVVGGKMTSAFAQGEAAAKMALKILSGTPAYQIEILDKSPNQYLFDHRELERFALEVPLGIGSHEIRNKPFSFYDEYRSLVWSIALVFIFILILLMFLIANVIKRRRSE